MPSARKGEAVRQTHGRTDENGTRIWFTDRLWELARDLPVHSVRIDSIRELDQNCWFHEKSPPTCRNVALHAQRIQQADLSYPIILSADGGLMDGGHRLCKAWLLGHTEIRAVRFLNDP